MANYSLLLEWIDGLEVRVLTYARPVVRLFVGETQYWMRNGSSQSGF